MHADIHERPLNLNSLLQRFQGNGHNVIGSKWYSFGLAIGVPKQFLEQLRGHPDYDCLVEVFDYWLRNHPGKPTWKEIVNAEINIDQIDHKQSSI